eukprot:TRINITY_DN16373_c0_g2_i1.p1 TRINITY_DN16373_c0_g2~~TRINITY_DN16373_c0_g2_i1.p1  ORF type:complete len:117 (+),score=22.10 TRINITY_DN16373_c0_g2_i1:93-443(+)
MESQIEVSVTVDKPKFESVISNNDLTETKVIKATHAEETKNESDLTFIEVKSKEAPIEFIQRPNHNTFKPILKESTQVNQEACNSINSNLVETDEFILAKHRKIKQMKELLKSLSP